MAILTSLLTVLLALVSLAMIGLILIQRGKGGGLAGAFGGGGVEQAFGTHAATMAQKATAVLGALFLILTVWLSILIPKSWESKRSDSRSSAPAGQSAPAAPSAPAPQEAK